MIINCFWYGSDFSYLEKLTLKSFIDHGYKVKLWRYEKDSDLDIYCPIEVEICDAENVLPLERLFLYTGNGDCRKGSIGGFSDLFRYYLLYKFEGVYVDMDCTCLAPFDFSEDYVIKPHKNCKTVANVLKAPVGSEFLKTCIQLTERFVGKDNKHWVLPVQLFNQAVETHELQRYIVPDNYFGCDDIEEIYKVKSMPYLKAKDAIPKYIMHWCREASYGSWSYREIYNWRKPKLLTTYYTLLAKHKLI
jgi:hypothetical protein